MFFKMLQSKLSIVLELLTTFNLSICTFDCKIDNGGEAIFIAVYFAGKFI